MPATVLLAMLMASAPALAQDDTYREKRETSFEITPYAAFFAGGNFDDGFDDNWFDDEIEVDEANGVGLIVGFEVSSSLDVELSYTIYETTLDFHDGLFGTDQEFLDLDIEYLHVGATWHRSSGHFQPFLLASIGGTRLGPTAGGQEFDDEVRPSVGLGGGFKIFFHDHIGVRLQGRVVSTLIEEDEDAFCDRRGCVYYDADTYLYQAELSAGLIFAF